MDVVRAQADDLRNELAEYERLRSGAESTFSASSLEELATVLVKARIARGWTQRQLAGALGMAEQQIQRYEANEYRSTSLARLCDIANALGVKMALTPNSIRRRHDHTGVSGAAERHDYDPAIDRPSSFRRRRRAGTGSEKALECTRPVNRATPSDDRGGIV